MKKIFTFPILILPFVLTSCNWSKLIDKFTPKREGVTFAEFRAAAEEADKKPRNYTGFICSGEFPDRNVYLDPTTIYFSELEEKEQNNKKKVVKHKKPLRINDYVLPAFNIPTSAAKGYDALLKKQLSKILTFIKFTQKRRYKDGCTAINIPTTSAENEWIWGSRANISNAIKLMETIGLIEVFDSYFRFNAFYKDENKSRTFKYYVDNERKLLEYCRKNNIEFYSPDDDVDLEPTQNEVKYFNSFNDLPNPKDVRFNSNTFYIKPLGMSKTKFERYLRLCLYQNYPFFVDTYKKDKEINKNFYKNYPEFLIRFWPSFTWGKKTKREDKSNVVIGIGIRATNSFCNKEEDERNEIIKQYGFDVEHDVRSSVPRLTLSLNSGKWISEAIDIYKLISEELDPNIEYNDNRREAIKFFHMRAYFDDNSKGIVGRNAWINMTTYQLKKEDVYDEMDKLKSALLKVEGGKLYGNEIFYVESVIYLMVLHTILFKEKQLVWLVYDCFYGKGYGSQKAFDIMVSGTIKAYFDMFYKEWAVIRMGKKRKVNVKVLLILEDILKAFEDKK